MIKTTLSDSRIVKYSKCGNGLPVILIHGFAEDHSIWKFQTSYLSEKYLIISIDLPGAGGSDELMNNDADISDFTLAIKDVLLTENIDKCVMMGHSMGGYITLGYQKKFPEDLLGIGLIHSTSFVDTDERIVLRKKSISFIEQNGSSAFLKTSIPGLFNQLEKYNEDVNNLLKNGSEINYKTLIQYYHAIMKRPDSTELIKQLSIPLLFIAGKHDHLIPINDSLNQAYISDTTHFHILKESAHMGMIEEPQELNVAIDDFLEYITEIIPK